MGLGQLGRPVGNSTNVLTTKDGQKIEVQTLSTITRAPESADGDIKLTSIDTSQLANGQVIHIPSAQNSQNAMQPITLTGNFRFFYEIVIFQILMLLSRFKNCVTFSFWIFLNFLLLSHLFSLLFLRLIDFPLFLFSLGAQGQQLTLIPASALQSLAQQGGMMRGVNVGGQVMQIQQNPGINTANGFLQSIPVQNIPGLGNVQVIPASALQPQAVQTLPAANAAPIVATHLDNADPTKWQILQTIQSNGTISAPASGSQQHQVNNTSNISGDTDSSKQHRRRVACTCPNCGDGDRYNLNTLPNQNRRLLSHFGKTYQLSEVAFF